MKRTLVLATVLAATFAVTSAFAEETPVAAPSAPAPAQPSAADAPAVVSPTPAKLGVSFGAKAGGILPFDGLSPWGQFGVELGLVLPALSRGIYLGVHADYSQPTSEGSISGDPRVTGGTYNWNITQQYLTVMPVVMYRLTSLARITPYVGVGPRIYFMRSTVAGSVGGVSIPETTEQSTAYGVGVPLGLEVHLGPGGVLAELLSQWGPFEHTATGPTHTGATSLSLGYRFVL